MLIFAKHIIVDKADPNVSPGFFEPSSSWILWRLDTNCCLVRREGRYFLFSSFGSYIAYLSFSNQVRFYVNLLVPGVLDVRPSSRSTGNAQLAFPRKIPTGTVRFVSMQEINLTELTWQAANLLASGEK